MSLNGDTVGTSISWGFTFVSSPITISNGGIVTIQHSLLHTPICIWFSLTCLTADNGYVPGDIIFCGNISTPGVAFQVDTKNIIVRYSNSNKIFTLPNKTTGNSTALTNANWNLTVYAGL